jgi:hypothetical protein
MVEQAKARVAAVKDSLRDSRRRAETSVKKKDEGPKPTDASEHPLVKKLKANSVTRLAMRRVYRTAFRQRRRRTHRRDLRFSKSDEEQASTISRI